MAINNESGKDNGTIKNANSDIEYTFGSFLYIMLLNVLFVDLLLIDHFPYPSLSVGRDYWG